MDTFELLKKLTEAPGPTGNESGIAGVIGEIWRPYVDAFLIDRVSSVVAVKRGFGDVSTVRPTLMLAAHQDELGLMVARIVEFNGSGFIRVSGLGGVDRRQLVGQSVVVHAKQPLNGVLGSLPDSYLPVDKRNQTVTWDELVLDVGLPFHEVRELVAVGDFITFRQPLRLLQSRRVTGKALDNRASVAAVTLCLQLLQGRRHSWDVIAVATAQEEETFLGAYTSAFSQRPDAAIAIDVTHAKGPGANDSELCELGGGPVLDIGVNVHPGLFKGLREAAEAIEMEIQVGYHSRASGTDAYAIQVTRAGIPTGLVSIPLRYMHTMVETVELADVERVGRLLAEMITRLDDNFLDNIKDEFMRPRTESRVNKEQTA